MTQKVQYFKLAFTIIMSVIVAGGALLYLGTGIGIPSGQVTQLPQLTNEQACATAGGTWDGSKCTQETPGYVPFTLSNVYMKVANALDTDATFGADDAYVRVYEQGKFNFVGAYLDEDGNAATTGLIDLDDKILRTGTSYTYLAYQGDGGTNLYAELDDFTIAALVGDKTIYTINEPIYMYKEGAFTESALDSSTSAWDESTDTVTLNKSATTVQGCLSWDFTYSNSQSGSTLKDPVIVFEDSSSDPLTDLNDVEEIYLSVKSGSGVSFPSGNLRSEFLAAQPITTAPDGRLDSADGITGTLKICFPASESDLGTGDILMHFDDLGDYRARDLDNDVRAAAETTTFDITT